MNPENSNASNNSSAFIDDYSHLRLSYYQLRGRNNSLSFNQSHTQDNSGLNHADTKRLSSTDSRVTTQDQDSSELERRRLREYYISQIPDLPHPSFTVASIIADKSRQMGGNFVYNNSIEQGKKDDMEFSPRHRSTMLPNQFKRGN